MPKNRKKTIKIDFKYFWDGFDKEDNLFTKLLKKHYNVEIKEDADYIFFSIYKKGPRDLYRKGKFIRRLSPILYRFLKKIYSKLKPSKLPEPDKNEKAVKIFFSSEYQKPDMKKYDWAFSYPYEEEINHPRYMRFPEYLWYGAGKNLIKEKNFAKKIINQKRKKFCNFIYSNNVDYRNEFFKRLSKYKKVDAPGRCMKNMPDLEEGGNRKVGISAEEWSKTKLNFMKNYKFTIAFENHILSGYTDEKLYHAMISGTIPIYLGNPDVQKDFNTKSFINCRDFKSFEEVIKKVIEIDKDDKLYEKILNEPFYPNNKPTKYVDIKRIEKRLKKIFK